MIRRYYRPELDVVRFAAFLLVFFHHTVPSAPDKNVEAVFHSWSPLIYAAAGAGRFGLSLFFALSAFLICELLLREREATGDVHVKQFYLRRILRIWPLYYFALALGVAWFALHIQPAAGPQPQIAFVGWFSVFMGAWYCTIYGWPANPVQVLWSISVEEQFYLFVPWILKFVNRRRLYAFCLVIILAANARLFYLGRVRVNDNSVWADSLVQFECFAAGTLLCLALGGRTPKLSGLSRSLLLFLSAGCWFVSTYSFHSLYHGATESPGSWALIAGYALGAVGAVLVLIAFLGASSELMPRWAVYFGRISYGLYVFHQFAIQGLLSACQWLQGRRPGAAVKLGIILPALAADILLAALSYRLLETPFLRVKRRHALVQSE